MNFSTTTFRRLLGVSVSIAAIAVVALAGGTTAASATTCSYPSPDAATFTISAGATCGVYGNGSFNANSTLPSEYTLIDRTGSSDGTHNGALNITDPNGKTISGATSGDFSISALSGYSSYLLVFAAGTGSPKPDWASFVLTADELLNGLANQTWSIDSGNNKLESAALFGIVAPVPLPAGLSLLGAGLSALGLLAWRKRRPVNAEI